MSVILRSKTLKDGSKSYYLDIHTDGRRHKEYINIHLNKQMERNHKADIKILAEAIRNKRERELIIEGNSIDVEI